MLTLLFYLDVGVGLVWVWMGQGEGVSGVRIYARCCEGVFRERWEIG